jgi:hypothetical protein
MSKQKPTPSLGEFSNVGVMFTGQNNNCVDSDSSYRFSAGDSVHAVDCRWYQDWHACDCLAFRDLQLERNQENND